MIEWCQSTTDLKLKELWYVCGNAKKRDEDKPSWQSKPEKETLKRNTRNMINTINIMNIINIIQIMKNSQVGNSSLQRKNWKTETMRQCKGIVREHMSTSPSLWPGRGDTIYLYSVGYFLNNILWRLQVTL